MTQGLEPASTVNEKVNYYSVFVRATIRLIDEKRGRDLFFFFPNM